MELLSQPAADRDGNQGGGKAHQDSPENSVAQRNLQGEGDEGRSRGGRHEGVRHRHPRQQRQGKYEDRLPALPSKGVDNGSKNHDPHIEENGDRNEKPGEQHGPVGPLFPEGLEHPVGKALRPTRVLNHLAEDRPQPDDGGNEPECTAHPDLDGVPHLDELHRPRGDPDKDGCQEQAHEGLDPKGQNQDKNKDDGQDQDRDQAEGIIFGPDSGLRENGKSVESHGGMQVGSNPYPAARGK